MEVRISNIGCVTVYWDTNTQTSEKWYRVFCSYRDREGKTTPITDSPFKLKSLRELRDFLNAIGINGVQEIDEAGVNLITDRDVSYIVDKIHKVAALSGSMNVISQNISKENFELKIQHFIS